MGHADLSEATVPESSDSEKSAASSFGGDIIEPDTNEIADQVLVVDDENHILKAVRRMFSEHTFDVVTAENGDQARKILENMPVAVLISDHRMPGMIGAELLDFASREHPNVVRVMLTGNNDVDTAIRAINEGQVFRFLTKPWEHDHFLEVVEQALAQHELLVSNERFREHIQHQNEKLRRLNDELEERVEERTREVRRRKQEISRLYRELQDSFDGVINGMLSIMELGDINVVEHCQRTASRVRMFGEHLGLHVDTVRRLERAALLHWIGLINAPTSLFKKPVEDFDAVERASWDFHPLLGQQAIRHIPALFQPSRFILHYRRRWDDPEFAAGNPSADESDRELTDEFITGCQVLAISSLFEQIGTVRGEAAARGDDWADEGLEVVRREAGGRFDPELVEAFVEMMTGRLEEESATEQIISFDQLESGMVLSRPLETAQGIPVAPRDMVITDDLLERLERFRDSKGLADIYVWE